jgi:hypothetical protein
MADETASAAAPPGDPFAGAKANLRDTIKWLVTIFAGLAAAVTAGASLGGVSGAEGMRLYWALGGGALGVLCLALAAGVALRLLTARSFFLGDLAGEPAIKAKLEAHAIDLLPPQIASLDDFLKQRAAAAAIAADAKRTSDERAGAGAFFASLEPTTARLVNLAQFEVMCRAFERARPRLFVLAGVALFGLGLFAVFSGPDKSRTSAAGPATAPLDLTPGKRWADVGQALADACGDTAPIKAQIVDRPQAGWVQLRLLTPAACSGMTITLPAKVVAHPAPPSSS